MLRQRVAQLAKKGGATRHSVTQSTSTYVSRTPSNTSRLNTRRSPAVVDSKPAVSQSVKSSTQVSVKPAGKMYKLLAIGTSTGGPVALQKILTQLPQNFPLPIIMVQHMPATFTNAFANRLNSLCKIQVKEASDGDVLKPGCAYLAPGGRQMVIAGTEHAAKIKIVEDNSAKITFKPSVDVSFGSASKVFSGNVLGIILTGMGADGREGSRMLKSRGSTIWAQDEQTCVVYGMPQAVASAGISQQSLPLDVIPSAILKEIKHG